MEAPKPRHSRLKWQLIDCGIGPTSWQTSRLKASRRASALARHALGLSCSFSQAIAPVREWYNSRPHDSNPRGDSEEGFSGGRYSCFFDLDTWRNYVRAAGFFEVGHYYRPPGLPRHQQPWLATVWRKGWSAARRGRAPSRS